MKIVYVAGRLTAPDNFQIYRNVNRAAALGMAVAELGAMPLIPHLNTGLTYFGTLSEEFWYAGTLELLRRCDAMILVPGWDDSKGVKAEVEEARRRSIPIFERVEELKAWLQIDRELQAVR